MTQKEKKKEDIDEDEKSQSEVKTQKNSKALNEEEVNVEENGSQEAIKLIEGKEPFKLEFYSKDDLIEKVDALEKKLAIKEENLLKYQNESSDWKNKYTRLQAEFENAQKRWNKNRENLRIQFTASIIKSFLPLYDSFRKALSENDENQTILKGFYNQFMSILKSYKAEPISVEINDPFDYNFHEALSSLERDDIPKNTILEIIQDGWKLDKDVIRYTKVIISREPKPPEPETVEQEQTDQIEDDNTEKPEKENSVDDKNEDKPPQDQDNKPENEYIS